MMKKILTALLFCLSASLMQAQITIGGNVFGGASQANVDGQANVVIHGGADMDHLITIKGVYGGNDIAGTVTGAVSVVTDGGKHLFVGQLFGGGNGDYDYESEMLSDGVTPNPYYGKLKPELATTSINLQGGTFGYVYGGGNAATVTRSASVTINNTSDPLDIAGTDTDSDGNTIGDADDLFTEEQLLGMGINTDYFDQNGNFQFSRVFGGNNKADMDIRPTWHLEKGSIENLYSGGNEGRMIHSQGLLLEIMTGSEIKVDNVFGGCRRADVRPLIDGVDATELDIQLRDEAGNQLLNFPAGLAARTLVRGGDIDNVYGGNDISGKVYGGNAVGIYTIVKGNVYGGGNGSYAYTDNATLVEKDPLHWQDFYYDPTTAASSVEALNNFRPNAEQVSIRVAGTDAEHPAIVYGSIFCGGNSATLKTDKPNPLVELKVGSHVITNNVFLGNNGENMVTDDIFAQLAGNVDGEDFSQIDLTNEGQMNSYMEAVAMPLMPRVVFDNVDNGDPATYIDYTAIFGSVFCGGNIGSMTKEGKTTINFDRNMIVFEKVVGGCNNAYLPEAANHAEYNGGIIGTASETNYTEDGTASGKIKDRIELNFNGLKIQPKRWKKDGSDNYDLDANGLPQLEWNTIDSETGENVTPSPSGTVPHPEYRFKGGDIYGGCYQGGHVNGNVVINLNTTIVDRKKTDAIDEKDVLFDEVEEDEGEAILYEHEEGYKILTRYSGVILDEQGMDVLGKALNVFGGGYGENSEIWGSTTINLNAGYTFQIFGGGFSGAIGRGVRNPSTHKLEYNTYDPRYSTTINLNGEYSGVYRGHAADNDHMAEAEFIYGGSFVGPIAGNTTINLGNGRIFNSFAGSCNADILGNTETYVGRNSNNDNDLGFPWIRDHIYGGNDLGGRIINTGKKDYKSRVSSSALSKVHNPGSKATPDVLVADAYTEYIQGHVVNIFGGCYGDYDYTAPHYKDYTYTQTIDESSGTVTYTDDGSNASNVGQAKPGFTKPRMDNAFVNFKPNSHTSNSVERIFGAGQGHSGDGDRDVMQQRSYILVDVPQTVTNFAGTEVFGAGAMTGLGMEVEPSVYNAAKDSYSAIIDLIRGHIAAAYGGSFEEGITRRTLVNVPTGSTITLGSIFAGAYGAETLHPCDVYEGNVEYHSADACLIYNPIRKEHEETVGDERMKGAIYGGNNRERRTFYGKINIDVPVNQDHYKYGMSKATIYGAGYGTSTWSEYTEVNLNSGAEVYEVYGGGEAGRVLNAKCVQKYMTDFYTYAGASSVDDPIWVSAWKIGGGYDPATFSDYASNSYTNLSNPVTRVAEMDDRETKTYKYDTNVIIHNDAKVINYAYGGGLGKAGSAGSGDVYGSTYIALLGGIVKKDLYAAGTRGGVYDAFDVEGGFIASSNAYIEGGTARNVYGGGWEGSVGKHEGGTAAPYTDDIAGETHVVIGKTDGTSFTNGLPAIERNAYGGGEGGAVFGTTHLTFYNGFVGYRRFAGEPEDNTIASIQVGTDYYQEKLDDETWTNGGIGRLKESGCIFGGGYIDNSAVDFSRVKMYGGHVRNAIFGGGEIAAVGRGIIHASGEKNSVRELVGIYKAGGTEVKLFDGHVYRNVFAGGRGYNNVGETGTLYTDGYVFGKTQLYIYGGEVGTEEGVKKGDGNVFGGGDIGYVYSAYEYEEGGVKKVGRGIQSGARWDDNDEGYYYRHKVRGSYDYSNNEDFETDGGEKILTEDCKVLIEPHCKVKTAVNINGTEYAVGDYVPTSALNALRKKDHATDQAKWQSLDDKGIIIYNAVFAGGNTSPGSDKVYANAVSVFGNATASIHDVYHRDLITIGTGRTGGLYGDGNLTFVDGYRGLNITNYGTDYYNIAPSVTYDYYTNDLTTREKAYYELRYECIQQCIDDKGRVYNPADENSAGSTISLDDFRALFANQPEMFDSNGEPISSYWNFKGVCSRYAGRLMNTIQRADFCGVFGSRMVMMGARDRVPEIIDFTDYTINRVSEVSLNKNSFARYTTAATDDKNREHGNYFGIYNVVNYLGALTSDVNFHSVRTTNADLENNPQYSPNTPGETFYQWKAANWDKRKRNNGSSHNQVALASGVYLELTTEQSRGIGLNEKEWGYITGVVELDLINVQPGMGGGFVYAKNVHGLRSTTGKNYITLTALNEGAATRKTYTYSTTEDNDNQMKWETSGNFIHSSLTIIDDCYNVGGKYMGTDKVPAHYWYIKGDVYIYEQYISAYTGSANAYSETVDMPLTITAASHGTMKLLDVQPCRYAYYSSGSTKLGEDQELLINNKSYHLNDAVNYWDWQQMTASQQALFVEMTYVIIDDCKIGEDTYPKGYVLTQAEYNALKDAAPKNTIEGVANTPSVTITEDNTEKDVAFDFVFRPSNNVSHDTGYILTYKVNNPTIWDQWYTPINSSYGTGKSQTDQAGYEDGPTYKLNDGNAIYGQRYYDVGNVISENTYTSYEALKSAHSGDIPANQATFVPAYIVTKEWISDDKHYNPGFIVPASEAASMTGYVEPAYVCTSTIKISDTEYIYLNSKMDVAQKNQYLADHSADATLTSEINEFVVPAYVCTIEGNYGGEYFNQNHNYHALDIWSSMSADDRQHFIFNYDALDLLIDPNYAQTEGMKYQYDSATGTAAAAALNPAQYSLITPVDYTATYNSETPLTPVNNITLKRNGITLTNQTEIQKDDELDRVAFESLPNEQRHYSAISVTAAGGDTYYVVHTAFALGNSPYTVGQTIDKATYDNLGTYQSNITTLDFTGKAEGTYYYCRESYTPVSSITPIDIGESYSSGDVPIGVIIAEGTDASSIGTYMSLTNQQKNFVIHGKSPIENSTFYVSRQSDIYDLTQEKIITVIYQYDYEEGDEEGHIIPVSERHVLNIHLQFKSGIPEIEDIVAPTIVLPGTKVGIKEPVVTPGAYEVIDGGWEIFEKAPDAESHVNGIEYNPNTDSLYWYQDGYYVAYYARTYLGKTYSNHVPLSVANYHDIKKVMDDKEHHYYVDYDPAKLKRHSKVYINDYSSTDENGLDLFKSFYDLSVLTGYTTDPSTGLINSGDFEGHAPLNTAVEAGANLEFFLRSNVKHTEPWTPIGTETDKCFEGNLHGDGYYISDLDHSLFHKLCGNVYNLGVMGSFTSAGIVDEGDGYVENCWIKTSATSGFTTKAVFGNPTRGGGSHQVVNCYYPEAPTNLTGDYYTPSDGTRPMPEEAFYNGEVAYNLNGFYLYKRYCDERVNSGTEYKNYYINADGTLTTPQTKYYASNPTFCSSGYGTFKYVEDRYGDCDFIYADGIIPEGIEPRLYEDDEKYYPIYPDDYLFFGQMLTYNWAAQTHQDVPSHLTKSENRLSITESSNRVYRAPAYFRSKRMSSAHFNPMAYLVAYSKPLTISDTNRKKAYPHMTAVDFAGHNDETYRLGLNSNLFYQPLLDDDGLLGIATNEQTQNLLVYAPNVTANEKTYGVLTDFFKDPAYSNSDEKYRRVNAAVTSEIHGHLVKHDLTTTTDHLLVDKQDFNCPIAYTLGTGNYIWYQRMPDNYVEMVQSGSTPQSKGWEAVSLPFTAELVTTQQKGEITHFYSGSRTAPGGTAKTGHEYWLREYRDISSLSSATAEEKAEALFTYPDASGSDKTVKNTFLWDYYYQGVHAHQDANYDTYQTYYERERLLENYPLLANGKPYIIGFPGKTYYEFDLSGEWMATTTAPTEPEKLNKQLITFVSDARAPVGISDDEMTNVSHNGYIFKPSYLHTDLSTGTNSYLLNADGSNFEKVPATGDAVTVYPFRPYFEAVPAPARPYRFIMLSNLSDTFEEQQEPAADESVDGKLTIQARRHKIVVSSTLDHSVPVRIHALNGITLASFVIEPGQTIETPVSHGGIYLVNRKKLSVK
jgi:hypothetical protein